MFLAILNNKGNQTIWFSRSNCHTQPYLFLTLSILSHKNCFLIDNDVIHWKIFTISNILVIFYILKYDEFITYIAEINVFETFQKTQFTKLKSCQSKILLIRED